VLLCIDGGNSGIKIALVERGKVIAFRALPKRIRGQLTPRSFLPSAWRGFGREFEGAVIATVVPELVPVLMGVAGEATGRDPLLVTNRIALPFAVGVRRPSRVGSDRLAAAAGAARRVRNGAIIIDIGSAITVDLLSGGSFRGGIIMAGPGICLRGLGEYTAGLPGIALAEDQNPFSSRFDETVSSMVLGAGIGALGAVREAAGELERREGRRMTTYVTGGGAASLLPRMPGGWRHRPYLVMEGLFSIWRLNNRKR
jgi:type III pantothenate kinase